MQASLNSLLGEKFGRRRSGRASSVFTASRLPEALSTTLETTENAPLPITSQTSKRRSKSRGVPNASPTVLDSASKAAPRSPCSSVGGAAASRSQDPLATPRGRFCEWCDGIAADAVLDGPALRRRLRHYVGGVRGRARRSQRPGEGCPGSQAPVQKLGRPGAALRCEGVRGGLPQSSDFCPARGGSPETKGRARPRSPLLGMPSVLLAASTFSRFSR